LEKQNALLKAQQAGLDVLSEKYQEIQGQITDNESAIGDIKASQEEWNDAVADLKMEALQKQRDELDKQNEAYQKRLDLEQATEDLEKAKTQKKLVYRAGEGFSCETDP
ncbi:MAG: hypothetical protein RRZ24_11905, partial [Clostridia bacterium]